MSDDDEEDDLDWDEIDKQLEKSQAVAPTNKLQVDYERLKEDYNELNKQLLAAHGETSILRSNLEKLKTTRQLDLDAKRESESAMERKYTKEVEDLKKELNKLKNERQFLVNDQQQDLIESRIRAKKQKRELQRSKTPVQSSPENSPVKKQRIGVDSDFCDGFISPKRKRGAAQQPPPRPESPSPSPVKINRRSSPAAAGFGIPVVLPEQTTSEDHQRLVNELDHKSYLLSFRTLIQTHTVPFSENVYTIEELTKAYPSESTAKLARSLHADRIHIFARECLIVLEQDHSSLLPLLVLPLLQVTIEFDPVEVLGYNIELAVRILTKLISSSLARLTTETEMETETETGPLIGLYSLDVLRSLCACSYHQPDLHRRCWSSMDPQFVESILDCTLPANVLVKSLAVVGMSITDVGASVEPHAALFRCGVKILDTPVKYSPVLYCASLENDIEPVERVGYVKPQLDNHDDLSNANVVQHWQWQLRHAVIKLFALVYASPSSSERADSYSTAKLVSSVVSCMSRELEQFYSNGHDECKRLIERLVWLLNGIYILFPQFIDLANALPSKTVREQLVVLSRIALGEGDADDDDDTDGNCPFTNSTTDFALQILERFMTSQETEQLDEIYDY